MANVFDPDNRTCNSEISSMELIIDKKRLHKIIDDLPDDSSLEDAIEQLILFHKVKLGLQQEGGRSQEELERESLAKGGNPGRNLHESNLEAAGRERPVGYRGIR